MKKNREQWAVFWCDLLSPVIYGDIPPEQTHAYLKETANRETKFPDGITRKPALSTLRRKLDHYQQGGFDALMRKRRSDRGNPRGVSSEVITTAVAFKTEQPYRSPEAINEMLLDTYGVTVPRATLYRHLKNAGATRLKLGVTSTKVRKRWTRDHSNALWVGDFADGPYVREKNEIVPTRLSVFIDCHSRYDIFARYYFHQNLDVLVDSLVQALSVHGLPSEMYLDNAKVYHATALKAACYRMGIRLLHRPAGDPATGGIIERLIQTIQGQLETEVRSGPILGLADLNAALNAWREMVYRKRIHSETRESPEARYQKGLKAVRHIDMNRVLESFLHSCERTVNRTFSDVRLDNRYYRVEPKLRGDRVQVRYDPFGRLDQVRIHALSGEYLGLGELHHRDADIPFVPEQPPAPPQSRYLDLLKRKHKEELAEQAGSIDSIKLTETRAWPFQEFAKTVADLLGRKAGMSALSVDELEMLKKTYNQSRSLDRRMVTQAFERSPQPTIPFIVRELKTLIKEES
jgi:transposase InsO family protein